MRSISDWKNEYHPECATCGVHDQCGGFFFSAKYKVSENIKAIPAPTSAGSTAVLGHLDRRQRPERLTDFRMGPRLRRLLLRQRRPLEQLKFVLESILVVAGIVGLALALWHHFDSQSPAPLPGEGKRVVAFRQLANRICTENRQNQRRAQAQNASRVERLGCSARALRMGPPRSRSHHRPTRRGSTSRVSEVKVRARAEHGVLALQDAIESGDRRAARRGRWRIISALEAESHELSREAGITRCMRILPPLQKLVTPETTIAQAPR